MKGEMIGQQSIKRSIFGRAGSINSTENTMNTSQAIMSTLHCPLETMTPFNYEKGNIHH